MYIKIFIYLCIFMYIFLYIGPRIFFIYYSITYLIYYMFHTSPYTTRVFSFPEFSVKRIKIGSLATNYRFERYRSRITFAEGKRSNIKLIPTIWNLDRGSSTRDISTVFFNKESTFARLCETPSEKSSRRLSLRGRASQPFSPPLIWNVVPDYIGMVKARDNWLSKKIETKRRIYQRQRTINVFINVSKVCKRKGICNILPTERRCSLNRSKVKTSFSASSSEYHARHLQEESPIYTEMRIFPRGWSIGIVFRSFSSLVRKSIMINRLKIIKRW